MTTLMDIPLFRLSFADKPEMFYWGVYSQDNSCW